MVDGVADFNGDWEEISKIVFEGERSPEECAIAFINLPINESIHEAI